jgi:hypothetical protein
MEKLFSRQIAATKYYCALGKFLKASTIDQQQKWNFEECLAKDSRV